MHDPSAASLYELRFPAAITAETEVSCPEYNALLTVTIDDPMDSQTYQYSECEVAFKVNWGA